MAVPLPEWLTALDPLWLNAATFGLMFVEGAGVPGVPGVLPMLAQAALITEGKTGYVDAVFWGALGNLLGSLAGYALGGWILTHLPPRWRAWAGHGRTRRLTEKTAPLLIALSRSVGSLRTPVTWTARTLGVPFSTFAGWSLVGALLHVGLWQYALWKFGEAALQVFRRAEVHLAPLLLVAAVVLLLGWVWRRERGRL
ncbi:DedA family protein [Deinococcus hopiensis]|uniref:DedA family protein n=1 Tax=Deinococcus hopiensis TaxID=309885 RepID=UPI003CCC443E